MRSSSCAQSAAFSAVLHFALTAGYASPDVTALPYASAGGTDSIADIYLRPEYPAGGTSPLVSLPTIILVHGGGYCCGDRSELNVIAERLKFRGFNVVNANYTLSVSGVVSAWPQAVRDVKSLIAWVRTDGVNLLGLNPNIVLVGSSAGATIVYTAAYTAGDPYFELGDPPPGGYAVQMVCGMSGRTNMPWDFDVGHNIGNILNYFGYWMSPESRSTFEYASAINHVSNACPPTAVYHSVSDPVVPFGHGQQLASALRDSSVPTIARFPNNSAHASFIFGDEVTAADLIASDICNLLNYAIPGFEPTPPPGVAPPPPPPPQHHPHPPVGPGGLADVAHTGGQIGPDGIVTVDDLIVYLSAFFAENLSIADLCGPGGMDDLDDALSADDLICFLNAFFGTR